MRNKRPIIKAVIVLICIMFSGITVSCAEDSSVQALKYQAQKYYWGRGVPRDYAKALSLYEAAAAQGDSEASYIVGGMYYTGKGTAKNPLKAFQYLHFAALNGKSSPESERALAKFFLVGDVVPQNYTKAVKWYEDAAKSGDKESQVELGFLYFVGKGVEQNYKKAFSLFRQAALQNYAIAQYNMGIMWYTGNGAGKTDFVKAYAWLSLAASNKFGDAVTARNYLESILDQDQLKRGQSEAARLFQHINQTAPVSDQ